MQGYQSPWPSCSRALDTICFQSGLSSCTARQGLGCGPGVGAQPRRAGAQTSITAAHDVLRQVAMIATTSNSMDIDLDHMPSDLQTGAEWTRHITCPTTTHNPQCRHLTCVLHLCISSLGVGGVLAIFNMCRYRLPALSVFPESG